METAILYLNITMTISIFVASLWYFFKVANIWRWIKLSYAVAMGSLLCVYGFAIFGSSPVPLLIQRLAITVLLATLGSGLAVSFCKLKVAKKINGHKENATFGLQD